MRVRARLIFKQNRPLAQYLYGLIAIKKIANFSPAVMDSVCGIQEGGDDIHRFACLVALR